MLSFPDRCGAGLIKGRLAHGAPKPLDRPAALDRPEPFKEIDVRQPAILIEGQYRSVGARQTGSLPFHRGIQRRAAEIGNHFPIGQQGNVGIVGGLVEPFVGRQHERVGQAKRDERERDRPQQDLSRAGHRIAWPSGVGRVAVHVRRLPGGIIPRQPGRRRSIPAIVFTGSTDILKPALLVLCHS